MAASQLVLALDALGHLDRALGKVVHEAGGLTVSDDPARQRFQQGVTELDGVRTHVRERVVASLVADDVTWRESMLRSRTNIVLDQLAALGVAAAELPAESRPFGDAFESVDALQRYLVPCMERIGHGLSLHVIEGAPHETQMTLRRVSVSNAELGFEMLGSQRDLIRALALGTEAPSERFSMACRALLLALGEPAAIASTLIPDLPPLPARSTGGAE